MQRLFITTEGQKWLTMSQKEGEKPLRLQKSGNESKNVCKIVLELIKRFESLIPREPASFHSVPLCTDHNAGFIFRLHMLFIDFEKSFSESMGELYVRGVFVKNRVIAAVLQAYILLSVLFYYVIGIVLHASMT